jgi:Flp pilus assembly protein TadD
MERNANSVTAAWCPTSGEILGEVVAAFRLDEECVGGKRASERLDRAQHSAKRYFGGEWLGPDQRNAACKAVVEALLASGILPRMELPDSDVSGGDSTKERLAEALAGWLAWWDGEFRQTATMYPGVDRTLAAFVLARPVVIDAALRWSSSLVLLGDPAPSKTPAWLDRLGGAKLLRAVLKEHWPGQTYDTYFVAFGVNERTFDRWISPSVDSEIPVSENIDRIAVVLAGKSGKPVDSVRTRLRREYGMFALLRAVAGVTGWPLALHLGTALVRMVADARSCARDAALDEAARGRFALGLLLGSHLHVSAVVVDQLLERGGKATPWGDDLRAMRERRVRERLERCFRALVSVPTGAPPPIPGAEAVPVEGRRALLEKFVVEFWLRDDLIERAAREGAGRGPSSPPGWNVDPRKLEVFAHIWRAESARASGDLPRAAREWQKVVELEPEDARHRFLCGSMLWQADKLLGRGDQLGLAEVHLRRSCDLAPDWDRPFVELAILWLNLGQPERALAHLRSGGDRFREQSDHFNHEEGVVLGDLGRLDEALASLERAVELNPQNALAWELAAHCAFLLLDKVKGRRYARRALHLGRDKSWREHCT